jgi:hypothetical protein
MTLVIAPAMAAGQLESWQGLLAVSARLPTDWCLVGGQLVQLHCWERGASPNRPTDDGDVVLDVRARPTIVLDFTQALVDEGFEAETSQGGLQHRWVKGDATIDVLIPTRLGIHARVQTARGGHPIATPGAPSVLNRAEHVDVRLPDRTEGTIPRPTLQGALIAKAYAYTVPLDLARDRHLTDFTVLSTLVSAADDIGVGLTRTERNKVGNALVNARENPLALAVEGGAEGLARLRLALS